MRLVIVETPFSREDYDAQMNFLHLCLRDCLLRGEAPMAAAMYRQPNIVNDCDPWERRLAIHAGTEWAATAEATILYTDFGITTEMQEGIATAEGLGRVIEYRKLAPDDRH
jgi:hypothetical protein